MNFSNTGHLKYRSDHGMRDPASGAGKALKDETVSPENAKQSRALCMIFLRVPVKSTVVCWGVAANKIVCEDDRTVIVLSVGSSPRLASYRAGGYVPESYAGHAKNL